MRIALLLCFCLAAAISLPGADCDSALQVHEKKGRLLVKNTSGQPITAYSVNSKSRDGAVNRRYYGAYSGGDSLGPGRSIELGKADVAAESLEVVYVRLADGWRCGEAPPEIKPTEE